MPKISLCSRFQNASQRLATRMRGWTILPVRWRNFSSSPIATKQPDSVMRHGRHISGRWRAKGCGWRRREREAAGDRREAVRLGNGKRGARSAWLRKLQRRHGRRCRSLQLRIRLVKTKRWLGSSGGRSGIERRRSISRSTMSSLIQCAGDRRRGRGFGSTCVMCPRRSDRSRRRPIRTTIRRASGEAADQRCNQLADRDGAGTDDELTPRCVGAGGQIVHVVW